jgi:hypothetical protein
MRLELLVAKVQCHQEVSWTVQLSFSRDRPIARIRSPGTEGLSTHTGLDEFSAKRGGQLTGSAGNSRSSSPSDSQATLSINRSPDRPPKPVSGQINRRSQIFVKNIGDDGLRLPIQFDSHPTKFVLATFRPVYIRKGHIDGSSDVGESPQCEEQTSFDVLFDRWTQFDFRSMNVNSHDLLREKQNEEC